MGLAPHLPGLPPFRSSFWLSCGAENKVNNMYIYEAPHCRIDCPLSSQHLSAALHRIAGRMLLGNNTTDQGAHRLKGETYPHQRERGADTSRIPLADLNSHSKDSGPMRQSTSEHGSILQQQRRTLLLLLLIARSSPTHVILNPIVPRGHALSAYSRLISTQEACLTVTKSRDEIPPNVENDNATRYQCNSAALPK
ncbi:hypothetical protein IQ07DRAFT_316154 [Pyrenochaeta sp. DS3sAY3a]|nr:hypothetical protein IQ07DRAFT_316154 [Pyrenochaeta sp. DS3sAY3a]